MGSLVFRTLYRVLRILDPLIRMAYRTAGLGNVHELRVRSRRRGQTRSLLLGLLRTDLGVYLGHPNGSAPWTRDLVAAGRGELVWRQGAPVEFRPVLLADGPEREAVIRATWHQHPFPGGLIYSAMRRHVRRHGVYFRLEPSAAGPVDVTQATRRSRRYAGTDALRAQQAPKARAEEPD